MLHHRLMHARVSKGVNMGLNLPTVWRFTVGLLSEMPPTDFMDDTRAVTCLLGLNINEGQEIKLRLRTNDLKVCITHVQLYPRAMVRLA
jgi:WLM domain